MITQKEKDIIIKDMMEGYPDANSSSLVCIKSNCEKMEFDFIEDDEKTDGGVSHHVDMKMLRKGFDILIELALKGAYNNFGFPSNVLGKYPDFDAIDTDALVQCAIFGDIIYG